MKRYMWTPDAEENKPIMVEELDGAWVMWDDVKPIIAERNTLSERIRVMSRRLHEEGSG